MRIEIAGLHEELGTTMIYVTHDQVEAMTMADKIVVLNGGRVEQVGEPLELYHRPANLFVAGFIGSPKMNLIKTRVLTGGGGRATVELPGGGTVAVPSEMRFQKSAPITLGVRPEHLTMLASATNGGKPAEGNARAQDGTIEGTVKIAERLGAETILYVEVPGADALVVRTAGLAAAKSGEKVRIAVPALACHIFDTEGNAMLNSRLDAPPKAVPDQATLIIERPA
jgi:multiple sugar transport system ATP-binding protein